MKNLKMLHELHSNVKLLISFLNMNKINKYFMKCLNFINFNVHSFD